MSDDESIDFSDNAGSLTTPLVASSLRKGGHVLIKGYPCKIVETSSSHTGKHGHTKIHIIGIDIFTGKKYEEIFVSTANVDVPTVKRTEYTLKNIDAGILTLLDDNGDEKTNVHLPEGDIGKGIQDEFEQGKTCKPTVWSAMNQEVCLGYTTA